MLLSVVVTVVDGGPALARCLNALGTQRDAPPLEIIVPFDTTAPGVAELCAGMPSVRALPMGEVATRHPPEGPAGRHELFDRRRSAGLLAATGDLVAIVEDRGVPRPEWARGMADLHQRRTNAVIGGAVDNGRDGALAWAVFCCDFSRYQPPFEPGPRDYVTDVNVCYKRQALDDTKHLWQERYHETTVHWALRRSGVELYLTPEVVVDQMRDGLDLGALLRERLAWGRLFAYTRARELGWGRRLTHIVLAPLLPFVLFARIAKRQLGLPSRSRFLAASLATLLLLSAWSFGEFLGYVTGES